MVSEPRKQSMAWLETDYSKHTHFRWKIKWRLAYLGALRIMDETVRLTFGFFLPRYVTVLYYLNDVEEGGETAFPVADDFSFNETVSCNLLFKIIQSSDALAETTHWAGETHNPAEIMASFPMSLPGFTLVSLLRKHHSSSIKRQ